MGKNVTVIFTGDFSELDILDSIAAMALSRDCTIGDEYLAYLPDNGEFDVEGYPVTDDDELWLEDDVCDAVVTKLSYGFKLKDEQGE